MRSRAGAGSSWRDPGFITGSFSCNAEGRHRLWFQVDPLDVLDFTGLGLNNIGKSLDRVRLR